MDVEFPVISMKLLEDERTRTKELARLAHALREWEHFQIIDHGIPTETIDNMSSSLKAFFELPLEEKLKGMDTQEGTRYDNKGVPLVNSHKLGYNKNCVPAFKIKSADQEPLEDAIAKPEGWVQQLFLQIGNPAVIWPEKPDGLKGMIEDYAKETHKVAQTILKCLAINVGLAPDAFLDAFDDATMVTVVNCNPAAPYGSGGFAAPRHRDMGGLNLLLVVDGVQGFQVWKEGKWWSVPSANRHALIVNAGDLMEMISNGRYKSVVHRGINCSGSARITVASNCDPNTFAKIGPVAGLIDDEHPRLYGEGRRVDFMEANKTKPITCFEYFSSLK